MPKRTSVRDVAHLANVSIGTVSNYLNKSAPVSLETQNNIQKAIDELGYKRNEIARSLRCARTKTLGVIFPNVSNPFYSSLFEGAEEEARRNGYSITLGISHYDNIVVEEYLNSFHDRQMEGVIVDGYGAYYGEGLFGATDLPIVVIEPPPGLKAWSTIEIDNTAAAQEAVEYLIGLGHRRIALIAGPMPNCRYIGYKVALEKHSIALDADLIINYDQAAGDLIAHGEKVMQTLLARTSFTACFVASDMVAVSVLKVLNECRYRVPEDIAVIGFDNIPFAALTTPPLTTIAQPHHEMGKIAVQMLLQQFDKDRSEAPVHTVLDYQLIIRGST